MNKFAVPLGFFFVGIAMIAAIAWRSSLPERSEPAVTETTPRQQTFDQMLRTGAAAIYVDNQPSGATEVSVGFAVMQDPGFVVAFADDGGVPGRAVGASDLLPPGGGEHVAVSLSEPLAQYGIYYAVLYRDDGDGIFDSLKDRQVTDASDNVVLMTFAAEADAVPEDGPVLP